MGKIVKVSGPLVVATGLGEANMSDVVRVGPQRLIGEILTMNGDSASIQVYEETSGLGPGAEVETTGYPMSVELGPGMIENIYDGIQRPLEEILKKAGSNNLPRGVEVPPIDPEKLWDFTPTAQAGDQVVGGDVIGTVPETPVVLLKIMVPANLKGSLKSVAGGKTLSYLTDDLKAGGAPNMNFEHELITVILNEGYSDFVMDAARAAGAGGGPVLHAKGTGAARAEKFFGVSLADEKDMVYIIAYADEKAAILKSINEKAGPGTKAGAI